MLQLVARFGLLLSKQCRSCNQEILLKKDWRSRMIILGIVAVAKVHCVVAFIFLLTSSISPPKPNVFPSMPNILKRLTNGKSAISDKDRHTKYHWIMLPHPSIIAVSIFMYPWYVSIHSVFQPHTNQWTMPLWWRIKNWAPILLPVVVSTGIPDAKDRTTIGDSYF